MKLFSHLVPRLVLLACGVGILSSGAAGDDPANDSAPRRAGTIINGNIIPHYASGSAVWSTEFQIFSLHDRPVTFTIRFRDDFGRRDVLDLYDPDGEHVTTASSYTTTVAPGAIISLRTLPSSAFKSGYALLNDSGNANQVGIIAVITNFDSEGRPKFRTSVPGLSSGQKFLRLPFNNSGGLFSGMGWMSEVTQNITLVARDRDGEEICRETRLIFGGGHTAFLLPDRMPCTAGLDGVLDIYGDFIGITAIRFTFDEELRFWTQIPYKLCCIDPP